MKNPNSRSNISPFTKSPPNKDASSGSSEAKAPAKFGNAEAVEPLIEALRNPDASVRSKAAQALGATCNGLAVGPLIQALRDKDDSVRSSAAFALGRIGVDEAVEPLVHTLNDTKRLVRSMAAQALGMTGSKEAVEPLIKALRDDEAFVKSTAALALGVIGEYQAVEPLVLVLRDANRLVRSMAAAALGKIGSKQAVGALIRALRDKEPSVRSGAAQALGILGSERAVIPLIKALKDADLPARSMAAEALGRIESDKAKQALQVYLRNIEEGQYSFLRYGRATAFEKAESERTTAPLVVSPHVLISSPAEVPEKLPDWPSILHKKLSRLQAGRIMVNFPDTMQVGVRHRIQARVAQDPVQDVLRRLKSCGVSEVEIIKVMRLSGDHFEIDPLNHEEQNITGDTPTAWTWDVLPLKSGEQALRLHVKARIKIPGYEKAQDYPVLDKKIGVH